jgi:hypothetical protein
MIELEHPYAGWRRCVRMANEKIELIATREVGPRIISFGFRGQGNELHENVPDLGKTGGKEWRPYGGHRLWHGPEAVPRTYAPDNEPVQVTVREDTVILSQNKEASTGIEKTMEVTLDPLKPSASIVHRVTNRGLWPVTLSLWPLTVLAPGGTVIVPLGKYVPFPDQLVPARPLVLWSYTDLSDRRFQLGARYLRLRQDREAKLPQKFGACVDDGWAAYHRGEHLFVKTFARPDRTKTYPDFGSNVEVFTNAEMIELETLSPLVELQPNGSAEHLETWTLIDRVSKALGDDELEAHVQALGVSTF